MPKRYRVLEDTLFFKQGDIVYDFLGHDYGLANDDSRVTGIEHTSVTLDPAGKGNSFTVPRHSIKEESEAMAHERKNYIRHVRQTTEYLEYWTSTGGKQEYIEADGRRLVRVQHGAGKLETVEDFREPTSQETTLFESFLNASAEIDR